MAHLVMEYSDPVLERVNINLLLEELHNILINSNFFKAEDVTSRTHAFQQWFVGVDNPQADFIHVRLWMPNSRNKKIKQDLSHALLDVAKKHANSISHVSVDIQNIDRRGYAKLSPR